MYIIITITIIIIIIIIINSIRISIMYNNNMLLSFLILIKVAKKISSKLHLIHFVNEKS